MNTEEREVWLTQDAVALTPLAEQNVRDGTTIVTLRVENHVRGVNAAIPYRAAEGPFVLIVECPRPAQCAMYRFFGAVRQVEAEISLPWTRGLSGLATRLCTCGASGA